MKKYVTEQMIYCVENNQIFPQDIQITKTQYITFGSYGLTLVKYLINKTKIKHINGYREMDVDEINIKLNSLEWVNAD